MVSVAGVTTDASGSKAAIAAREKSIGYRHQIHTFSSEKVFVRAAKVVSAFANVALPVVCIKAIQNSCMYAADTAVPNAALTRKASAVPPTMLSSCFETWLLSTLYCSSAAGAAVPCREA
jgi:hypothetical protein